MASKRWIGWIAIVAFFLTLGWPARGDGVDSQLFGVWQVKVTPDDDTARAGKLEFRDQLLFEEDSTFTAEAFGPMGFAPAHASPGDGDASFVCMTQNDSQGTIVWSGTCDGSHIEGTMTWTKPDGSVCSYTFSGAKKS